MNNLKQIGLALHSFHDTNAKFPPAGSGYGWCQYPARADRTIYNSSGWTLLLPYLEQGPLYQGYNLAQAACDNLAGYGGPIYAPDVATLPLAGDALANVTVLQTPLSVFLCPSDPGIPVVAPLNGLAAIKAGTDYAGSKTNYDFLAPGDYSCNAWMAMATTQRPMFGENSATSIAQALDGMSQTIAVGETTLDLLNGAYPPTPSQSSGHAWGYRNWCMVGIDMSGGINQWDWPNFIPSVPRRFGQVGGWYYAGSNHPGGANFLFGDGHVKFIQQTAAIGILSRLGSMADGNPVSETY